MIIQTRNRNRSLPFDYDYEHRCAEHEHDFSLPHNKKYGCEFLLYTASHYFIAAAIFSPVCFMISMSPGMSSHAVIVSSGPSLTLGIK